MQLQYSIISKLLAFQQTGFYLIFYIHCVFYSVPLGHSTHLSSNARRTPCSPKATHNDQEDEVDEVVEGVCIHDKVHDVHPAFQRDDLMETDQSRLSYTTK